MEPGEQSAEEQKQVNQHTRIGVMGLRLALGISCGLLALTAEAGKPGSMDAFDTADLDGDGVVTDEEYRLFVVEQFYFSDTNRDGTVSDSDAHQWAQAPMQAADEDGSNSVSLREMVNASRRDFVVIDQDSNNVLTREEVEAYESQPQ
jgi:Ca2+-binding EF-hand superfamily protein